MVDAVIVDVVRSPIGRAYKGSLIGERPDALLLYIVRALFDRVPELDPAAIDEILLGCSLAGGEQGGNLGRVIAVLLGLDNVPGYTLNRYCASSMQTTRAAAHAIAAGDGHAYLSLGLEMVSRLSAADTPEPSPEQRSPLFADSVTASNPWVDPRLDGRIPDVFISMGETAENVAGIYGISRRDMDEYALRSQTLAAAADAAGFWDRDITPVRLADGSTVSRDDSPRPSTTLEGLGELAPVFRPDGLVTAGNACPVNDGAAAVLVMSDVRARELGLSPRARILSTAVSALSPEIMGLGTIEASQRALSSAGLTISDVDLIEINEAFAAQVIPTYRALEAPLDKVNVHGGALALGHPYGMSGARITSTLLNGLDARDARIGLQTMCVAGGQGMAMVVERIG